jgi:hypothetical protein
MKQALIYSLKAWLTTSIIAPLLITLLLFIIAHKYLVLGHIDQAMVHRQYIRLITRMLYMIAGSLIMWVPLGIALYYTITYLDRKQVLPRLYKWYLSIPGLFAAVLPYVLILCYTIAVVKGSYSAIVLDIAIRSFIYAIVAMASIWLYKLQPVVNELLNEPTL